MIFCLDTSAINQLLDDPESEPIIKALLSVGSFRITAYNVLEAATKCEDRRYRLIDLLKRLAQGKRPLDRPNTILLSYAKAHADGASAALVNADNQLNGVWIALNEPELVDEKARQEVISWAAEWEDDFSKVVAGDRDQFQALFRKGPTRATPNNCGCFARLSQQERRIPRAHQRCIPTARSKIA